MLNTLQQQINELDTKARKIEEWLLNNTASPFFNKKVYEYSNVLFKLAQKREQENNEGRDVPYRETVSLPRFILQIREC